MSLLDVLNSTRGGSSVYTPRKSSAGARVSRPYTGPTSSAANSRERGLPERIDVNKFVPQGFGQSKPPDGFQIIEGAARAPGFVLERPLAIADQILGGEEGGTLLDEIGEFGPIKFLGDVVNNVSSIPAAWANSNTANPLAQGAREGWSDDFVVNDQDFVMTALFGSDPERQRTYGELKVEAARRGFTAEDVEDINSGRKSVWDFPDKMTNADPMGDLIFRLSTDPLNFVFGAGAVLKVGKGIGLLGKAIKAGAVAEKTLPPSLAAIAARQGIGAQSTWMGLARYFGEVGRGLGAVPGGALLAESAAQGFSTAARAGAVYKKTALAASAGQVGIGLLDHATEGFRGGFMEGLFQANREIWDNQPLSGNSAFMVFSAFQFDPSRGLGRIVKTARAAKYQAFGSDTRGRVLEALSQGESWQGKGSKEAVLESLGGPEALDNLIVHTHAQMVMERLMRNPAIKATLTHFDSLDQAILANSKLGEMIETILKDEYVKGGMGGRETVNQLKKWHAQRSGIDQKGIEFQWDGRLASDRWVEYGAAVAPVSDIFHKRGDIVMGLVDTVMAEDIRNIRAVLRVKADDAKTVSVAEVRYWMNRFPQIASDEWFGKFNLAEQNGKRVPVGPLFGKLKKLEKDAPTARDMTHEMAVAEKTAARDEIHQAAQPENFEAGGSTIGISRMRPAIKNRLGMRADQVEDIVAARSDPEVAAYEGRFGQTMSDAGFEVDEVSQSIGGWAGKHEPSIEVSMPRANVDEIRLAAAIAGRAGAQNAVIWASRGTRMRQLGLSPNGYEAVIALPSLDRSQAQSVAQILSRELGEAGYTINDTKAVVRILAKDADAGDLAVKLERIGTEIEGLYPRDAVGDTGLAKSVHPAYVEHVGKKGHGDFTYDRVIRDAKRDGDPRGASADSVRSALAHRRRSAADVGSGLGPEQAVGRDAGDAGRPAVDPSLPPAAGIGPGDLTTALADEGYLYHVTTDDVLRTISEEGLRPHGPDYRGSMKWPDGGTGARNWFVDKPEQAALHAQHPTSPLLRVRDADAGRVRRDLIGREPYAMRRVPPSLVEIYGADGNWHPLNEWFDQPLEPDILAGAQQNLPEYQAAGATGPFDPVPDPLTAGLRAHEDAPFPEGMAGDETALREQLATAELTDDAMGQADNAGRRLEAAQLAKGEARKGQVLWMARRDAEASSVYPFHRSLSKLDAKAKAELASYEQRLREEYPAYTLQRRTSSATLLMPEGGSLAAQYLRQRTVLGNIIADWGPFGKINRTLEWLASPVRNEDLGRAARQALMNELVPAGAKPSEVDRFLVELDKQVNLHTFGDHEVRAFRNGTNLGQQAINKIARGDEAAGLKPVFSQATIARIGPDNFARALDRASNRFIRAMNEKGGAPGGRGALARGLAKGFRTYQNTPIGDTTRYVSKTMYHWFRFISDLRWHAMNQFEADIIGGLKYSVGGARKTEAGAPARAHMGGVDAKDIALADNNGWFYARRQAGYISRAFDHERPETVLKILRQMPETDPIIRNLKSVIQAEDLKARRTVRTEGEILDDDMVEGLDRMLYSFDQKGVRATVVEEAEAVLGHAETVRLMPFLQKVWEANDQSFKAITGMFHGNSSRSNLERIANSYWLYWPLSYQVKATKWLVSTLFGGAFGRDTKMAGAALYAHHAQEHRKRLASSPAYASMFEDNPTLWFAAQMMFPISPGDIGVSLSRPVRYVGGWLGLWGEYKQADNAPSAAAAILSIGPVYTAELLARWGQEMADNIENLAP